jgi:hypothetical protein
MNLAKSSLCAHGFIKTAIFHFKNSSDHTNTHLAYLVLELGQVQLCKRGSTNAIDFLVYIKLMRYFC